MAFDADDGMIILSWIGIDWTWFDDFVVVEEGFDEEGAIGDEWGESAGFGGDDIIDLDVDGLFFGIRLDEFGDGFESKFVDIRGHFGFGGNF